MRFSLHTDPIRVAVGYVAPRIDQADAPFSQNQVPSCYLPQPLVVQASVHRFTDVSSLFSRVERKPAYERHDYFDPIEKPVDRDTPGYLSKPRHPMAQTYERHPRHSASSLVSRDFSASPRCSNRNLATFP